VRSPVTQIFQLTGMTGPARLSSVGDYHASEPPSWPASARPLRVRRRPNRGSEGALDVLDLVFVLVTVVSFAVLVLVVRGGQRL